MSIYDTLNKMQKEAVQQTEGPVLLLAGAGSGKTRVITHRIAYLIDEIGVKPWNILAITFTNKAAGEMRERVDKLVESGGEQIWVSTFHSACIRILRRQIGKIGFSNGFSVYDTDDRKVVMKDIVKEFQLDPKVYKEAELLRVISSAKDDLISVSEYAQEAVGDSDKSVYARVYKRYQEVLEQNQALDFDDIIVKTVELFRACPDVLETYQERFQYIMVDEYQDTNHVQFKLVELLAKKYRNLCVVGDDDQSIYRFRGADIRNILEFEEAFPGAKVVKLEQNYRSTGNILTVANEVIRHNRARKAKTLWTANEEGGLPSYCQFDTGEMEADFIARLFQEKKEKGRDWKDMAVLYRTNAQSRLLEEACVRKNIPYLLVGGVNFYQRKEIKDVLAYLKTIANGVDDLSVSRIINVPRRGIGTVTIGRLTAYSAQEGIHLYDAIKTAKNIPGIGKSAEKVVVFFRQIEELRAFARDSAHTITDLIEAVLKQTGYQQELEAEEEEGQERLENIQELISKAAAYERDSEHPSLDEFLELVALVADVDRMDDADSRVTLMTMHSAKGLEFPLVAIAGMEDGLFPNGLIVASEKREEMEEERRLCYVGMTRAKEELFLTGARFRMINGETRRMRTSQFVREVPQDFLEVEQPERLDLQWSKPSGEKESPKNQILRMKKRGTSPFQPGNTSFGKSFSVVKAESLDYQEGDRVRHGRFGEGTVEQIKDGPKDYEVTVCFDKVGVKKMFASFAKLERVE